MGGLNPSVRRSLDAECSPSPSSSGGSGSGSGGGPSTAASMLLMRPRAFARQLSDDLRRRRQSFAAPTGAGKKCYSPLAGGAGGPGGPGALSGQRHSMAGIIGHHLQSPRINAVPVVSPCNGQFSILIS